MQANSALFILLVTFIATNAFAQNRELDLKSTVLIGLENSPELKQAESKRKEARAVSWELKAELFPEISARATSERRMNSGALRTVSSSPSASTATEPYSTYLAAIDLKQPIFTGWSLISGLKLASSMKDSAEKEFFASQQATVRSLIEAFYDFAAANDYYRAASTNFATLQNYSQSMARYAKIGRGREMDRLQASVNASLSEIDTESALQRQLETDLRLKTLLNLPPQSKITARFDFEVQPIDPITIEQALQIALKNNPQFILLQRAIEQREWQNDITIAPDRPSLAFVASYGTQALEREDMFHSQADFYSYGLALTIPLFSGFSTMAKKRELNEQVYQAERAFEIEKRNLRERIRNALANVTRLHQQYQNLQTVTKNSQRALDLVNSGFRQGTSTSQDVVNFQSNRYQAEKKMIEIQYSYLKSVADLRELLGVDLLKIYGGKAGES